jgi:hypothetical protein
LFNGGEENLPTLPEQYWQDELFDDGLNVHDHYFDYINQYGFEAVNIIFEDSSHVVQEIYIPGTSFL